MDDTALVSLAKVKTMIPLFDTQYNTVLQEIINDVCAQAIEYMDLDFEQHTAHVEYVDGGSRTIFANCANLSNVRIWIDTDKKWNDENELDSSYFTVYGKRGVIKLNSGIFPAGLQIIKLRYDSGYAQNALPKGLQGKLLKQITYEFRRRNDPGLTAVSFPDGSVQKWTLEEWLPDVQDEFDRWRRMTL
ncbi:MAG: hypothetical protein FJ139_11730 [Deltaproteobacteria bacterium]|nr:hypothetical protein [Deltaproteobacteria bacterium]